MKKLLLLLLVSSLAGVGLAQVGTTVTNRGSNDETSLEAAQKSVENQLIVEEIEDAGYEIDVEEGFDEEWEEEIWVASEADDVDANYTDPTETARFDLIDVPKPEEIAEGWSEEAWENPELVVDDHENAVTYENQEDEDLVVMRGDEETAVAHDDLQFDTEIDADQDIAWEDEGDAGESNWWEDADENWASTVDEMEMDPYDAGLDEEEEDLDLLEELYNAN